MVDDDWRGLRRAPDGTLCWYGWAIFGHLLPRLGVVAFPCFRDGEPVEAIGGAPAVAGFQRRGLVAEWLGLGVCIAFGRVYPR